MMWNPSSQSYASMNTENKSFKTLICLLNDTWPIAFYYLVYGVWIKCLLIIIAVIPRTEYFF